MKRKEIVKVIVFISAILINLANVKAQDKIHKTDSTVVDAKIIEIGVSEIKYNKFNNQNGPIYIINKSKVAYIVYQNGEKEIYKNEIKTTEPIINNTVKLDSLELIEQMWGVKFENTTVKEGGVMIVKLESNSIIKQNTNLKKLYIFYMNNGKKIRIKNTSELARAIFDSYNSGISKINLSASKHSKLAYFTYDPLGLDISGISKFYNADANSKILSKEESKKAGGIVANVYKKGYNWAPQGFCSGLVFGVAGVVIVGGIAMIPPSAPNAPPNVDSKAWKNAYRSKIRNKRMLTGLISSVIASVLVIAAFSSNN